MNYAEGAVDLSEYAKFSSTLETETPSTVDIEWFGNAPESDYVVAFIPGILAPSNQMAQSFYENLDDKLKIASMGLRYNEKQGFNLPNITTEITQEVAKYNKPVVLVGYSFGAFLALEVAPKVENNLGVLLIAPCIDDQSIKNGFIEKFKKHPQTMERLLKSAITIRGLMKPTTEDEQRYAIEQIKSMPEPSFKAHQFAIITAFTEGDRFINRPHVEQTLKQSTSQYRTVLIPNYFVGKTISGVLAGHDLDQNKLRQLNTDVLIPAIETLL